jgi:hypothetical protein
MELFPSKIAKAVFIAAIMLSSSRVPLVYFLNRFAHHFHLIRDLEKAKHKG